jgi:hypothetical protein
MSVAHLDLGVSDLEVASRRIRPRLALLLGGAAAFALAAVPAAVSVLLFTRPDLFLAR